jgi:membrane-bound lytic murein transglycosylase D
VTHYAAATPVGVQRAEAQYAAARQAEEAREEAEAAGLVAFAARTEPTPETVEEAAAELVADGPEMTEPEVAGEPEAVLVAEATDDVAEAEEGAEAETAAPAPPTPSFVARRNPTPGLDPATAEAADARPEVAEATPAAVQTEADAVPPVRTVSTASERPTTHRVARGEYLTSIARQYGMSLGEIRALNPGLGDHLAVGQRVRVSGAPAAPVARPAAPARPTTHRVRSGEHLTGIAREYGVTVRQLMEWNDLDSDVLRVGQRLRVAARGTRG